MNVIACVKRVPDSAARIRPAADGKSINAAGVKFVTSPFDELALEEALRQRDEAGEGTVTAISVGPPECADILRSALALGADEAVLLSRGEEHRLDPVMAAGALAEEIRECAFDLVLTGKQAIDDEGGQAPALLAEALGVPFAPAAVALTVEDSRAVARREVEGGLEILEFDLPAVVSVDKGINLPRYPNLKGIMAAKRKPLEVKEAAGRSTGRLELVALEEPPPKGAGRILGEGPDAARELAHVLREEESLI